jgi:predicted dehydrogenase
MTKIGVSGLGHWGPNHVRVFTTCRESTVTVCCDTDTKRRQGLHKDIRFTSDLGELLADDAVVIATPTSTHYEIAARALKAGKHILCEKPLTECVENAVALAELAAQQNRVLMTGFVFLFNAGIRRLK